MNIKIVIITTTRMILPLFSMLVVSCTRALAIDYYVDIKGSDKGKGTQYSPWRTLNKALTSLPADQKHTIRVGRGTFYLGGNVSIPSGVNLIGAGIASTTIMGELRLVGVQNLTLSDIKLSGNQYKYDTALYIRDANQINIRNIVFNQYRSQAISIERTSNSELSNLDIFDCTYNHRIAGGGGTQSRAIDLANLTNVKFHDIIINTLTRGGQGIGSMSDAWIPKGNSWGGPDSILKNVSFYNLDIKVDKWNAWWTGWTPQMALELFRHKCYKCEIFNSTFNSTVSLASSAPNKNNQDSQDTTNIHIHHNLWYGLNNPFYACEVSSNNIEFNHNYIYGGFYPIASFGNLYKNLNVHHNFFVKTKKPILVGLFMQKRDNFKFVNNTVYIEDSIHPIFRFARGEGNNQEIRNNIFYNSSFRFNNQLNAFVGLDNNLFFKINPIGRRAMVFDPKMKFSGNFPTQYYMPNINSQAWQLNLGAVHAGNPVWTVGKRTNLNFRK